MKLQFWLLAIYQAKHFFADYPLQGQYMLGKFKPGRGWILPLLAHAGVHGLFTFFIVLCVRPELYWLALVDLVSHFIMDRMKASPRLLGRFKPLTAKRFQDCLTMPDRVSFDDNTNSYQKHTDLLRGNTLFWWSLGLDQMVHHLTHYYIIWRLVG